MVSMLPLPHVRQQPFCTGFGQVIGGPASHQAKKAGHEIKIERGQEREGESERRTNDIGASRGGAHALRTDGHGAHGDALVGARAVGRAWVSVAVGEVVATRERKPRGGGAGSQLLVVALREGVVRVLLKVQAQVVLLVEQQEGAAADARLRRVRKDGCAGRERERESERDIERER